MSAVPARHVSQRDVPILYAPTRRRHGSHLRRGMLGLVAVLLTLVFSAVALVVAAPSASAASQGPGFGSWAPLSPQGWHGSMMVGDVDTYCISPGLPAPTGGSVDNGVRTDARGLSPQQLTGINLIVSTHGQTDDPVQAAAVGWAVKAIADWDTTLHAWGYAGDSLAGAVHERFDRFWPDRAGPVAQLAERFYAEAMAAVVPGTDASLALTTDSADPRRGTVRLEGGAGMTASVTLVGAVFAASQGASWDAAPFGVDLPIVVPAPADGMPVTVRASARLTAAFAPAVRYITTPGQQDTAGPGGGVEYTVEAEDAAPRPVVFSPGITTQVAAPEVDGGRFVDDVTVTPVDGVWPRTADGEYVPLKATATVYRTDTEPARTSEVPADAAPVGDMTLTTDPATGGGTYRVESDWELPGPGVYTAVWRIAASDQAPAVAAHLEREYVWSEQFGTPSQITRVPTPPPAPASQTTEIERPQTLAATGPFAGAPRIAGAGLAALVLGCALLAHLTQQRRRLARPDRRR